VIQITEGGADHVFKQAFPAKSHSRL